MNRYISRLGEAMHYEQISGISKKYDRENNKKKGQVEK